jgi:uracil-DNA glycosylase
VNSNLNDWAEQHILLLNMSLTVIKGNPNSHKKLWASYTNSIINTISSRCDNVIFILLGNDAKKKKKCGGKHSLPPYLGRGVIHPFTKKIN